jgi:hypothetical protein
MLLGGMKALRAGPAPVTLVSFGGFENPAMYFWRIDRLKQDLRSGLTERESFRYLFFTLVLYAFCAEIGLLFPEENPNRWSHLIAAVCWVAVLVGTYFTYRSNGGANGHRFAERFFAITWVVGIRLMVLAMPILLAVYIGIELVAPVPREVIEARWYDVLLVTAYIVLFYWRVCKHLTDVAASSHQAAAISAPR